MSRTLRAWTVCVVLVALAACGDDSSEESSSQHPAARTVEYVAEAVEMYDAEGADATLEHYNTSQSMDGQWYLAIMDLETRVILTHAFQPDRVGNQSVDTLTDDGRPVTDAAVTLTDNGPGWITYNFINPVSDQLERKHVWFVRHDGFVFASGYYEPLNN